MNNRQMAEVILLLEEELQKRELPIVSQLARERCDPFEILISTLLSLRTKDEVTAAASEKLFALASTPQEMLRLTEEEIRQAIYPVGFYRNKAGTIRHVCRELIARFDARVPETLEELLTFKGVGRKTANLVVSLGFNGLGLCVDTHVHRISNRMGYVRTKTPAETEFALREKLPAKHWSRFNTLLVAFGRNTCRPVSPLCSACPVSAHCDRVNVKKSR
ncbi:MAG: endonuclease III [Syntrophobacterales bacterium RBG_19FT_COMBO_59_10]|nr:MAG: endonuclease III [Syntrophobacterales bacterium RBG_19FT_COMBO_59_10]